MYTTDNFLIAYIDYKLDISQKKLKLYFPN